MIILFAYLTDFLSNKAINKILFYLSFYLALKLVYLFASTFLRMKVHWSWYNRKTTQY